MGLFKKKEPREITEEDGLLTRLWLNPRTHAMMILGFYFIFFAILLILIKTAGSIETEKEEINGSVISESFKEKIADKDISYNVAITKEDDTYYFQGDKKVSDEKITGTIMHNGTATNIEYNEDGCNVLTASEEVMLCPEEIDYKYFNINNIYEDIKSVKTSTFKHNEYFVFEIDKDTKIKVYLDSNKYIEKILINDKDSEYDFKYQFNTPIIENIDSLDNE